MLHYSQWKMHCSDENHNRSETKTIMYISKIAEKITCTPSNKTYLTTWILKPTRYCLLFILKLFYMESGQLYVTIPPTNTRIPAYVFSIAGLLEDSIQMWKCKQTSQVMKVNLYHKDQQDALFTFNFSPINNLYVFWAGLLLIIRRYCIYSNWYMTCIYVGWLLVLWSS
jgi:hypothetical protein